MLEFVDIGESAAPKSSAVAAIMLKRWNSRREPGHLARQPGRRQSLDPKSSSACYCPPGRESLRLTSIFCDLAVVT